MPGTGDQPSIMVIAGEPSGDLHAGNLCREIRRCDSRVGLFGMGGERMAAAGVELVQRIDRTGVIGFWEVFRDIGRYRRLFRELVKVMRDRRPSAVVLVDYPGFNLRFARAAHSLGVRVIYYISPQVWAWGKRRIRVLKECVDRMVVIFEFEKKLFESSGLAVDFVGHPLLDALDPGLTPDHARRLLHLDRSPVIALLPGSRPSEVSRHLPLLIRTGAIIRNKLPESEFVVSLASPVFRPEAELALREAAFPARLVEGRNQEVLAASDLALVASGTATLEAAVLGVPMIIVYKLSFFSWLIARALIKIPYIGLANVVSGRRLVPEYVQFQARPARIAGQALGLLQDAGARAALAGRLKEVKAKLGTPGASRRAARAVLAAIRDSSLGATASNGNA